MRYIELTEANEYEHGAYIGYNSTKETQQNFGDFCIRNQIPNALDYEKAHVSLMATTNPYRCDALGRFKDPIEVDQETYHWEIFPKQGDEDGCLVLRFNEPFMEQRWQELRDDGAIPTFDPLKLHMTFSYSVPMEYPIELLPLPDFVIQLESEYEKPFDPSWNNDED